jgi:cobalt-zinc-cadmium efflux system outer membrane protein
MPALAGGPPDTFSLKQLVALAQSENKDLQAARYAVDIGRARLLQAGLRQNPRLDVSLRSDFLFSNDGEHGSSLAISQEFPIAGRISRQKDVARVDIALAEAEVAEAERQLADEVAGKTYRLLVSQRQASALDDLIRVEDALAKTTRARFRAAEVSELDVNTVQLDIQRLGLERSLLQSEQQALVVALNTLLGRPATTALTVVEPLPDADAVPALSQLQDRALRQRPDLRAALLSVDRAAAEKSLAHAMRWQDWSVGLELSQDKQVILGTPPQGTDRAIGVSVSVPLPLFNKSQGLVAEADANGAQASARVDAARLTILSEVAGAHAEAARLQALLAQFGESTRPVSERSVRLARQGYQQGLIPIFDVVQAQRQQAELNKAYLSTFDQFLQALVRLHTATGDYTPNSLDANLQP